jgi:acyl carrier protein
MERQALRNMVIATLRSVAPEIVDSDLASDRPLRQQVDLDSMDWLHFLIGLHQALQIDIPESDYGRLHTLDDLLDYLTLKLQGRTAG